MPQFSVHANPGRDPTIVYVVQVQSSRLERSRGRLVMPLVRRSAAALPDHPLTPWLTVNGEEVFADPFGLATVPASRLGAVIATLAEPEQDRVLRALDELISRAWRLSG